MRLDFLLELFVCVLSVKNNEEAIRLIYMGRNFDRQAKGNDKKNIQEIFMLSC